MKLSNKTYDVLKWLVWVFLPSLGVILGVLGQSFGWTNTDTVLTILTAFTTFLGTITGVSNREFNKEEE
ncbi:phage holin [Aerococcus urinaeequi]|uniref:phage holin n=1 Tax=Aerococcus urinaeequi TaxID=51665 RepID=UPI003D6ABD2A